MKTIDWRAVALALLAACGLARADVISDWNAVGIEVIAAERQPAPFSARTMSMMHVAMFDAVNAIQPRYKPMAQGLKAEAGASADAAASAAARAVLLQAVPGQSAAIEKAYAAALAKVADESARNKGIAVGAEAGKLCIQARADDGTNAPDAYRPRTTPGVYVFTGGPVFHAWASAKPWVLKSPSQFRPAPPPDLASAVWKRDVSEIQRMGGRTSTERTQEQTDVGRFWILTGAAAWNEVLRTVAANKKLDTVDNARLFALANVAGTDALVAVFDAKYAYEFWRPVTAIRNGPDGERDPRWSPLIETPGHPEYPCAHCISSTAVATVLQKLYGDTIDPPAVMTSPTAPGVTRRWTKVSDYQKEVSNARIWSGVHYRNSTEVGEDMGRRIGETVVANAMTPR